MPGNCLQTDGGPAFAAGLFGDYPYYYVEPGSYETVDRPARMVQAYRASQRKIKGICEGRRTVYTKSGTVGPWISRKAWELVRSDSALLANDELEIDTHAA